MAVLPMRARHALAVVVAGLMMASLLILSVPAQAAVHPVLYPDAYPADEGQPIEVDAPGILANDFGVTDEYQVRVVSQEIWGTAELDVNGDGSFRYDAHSNGHGENSFTYCIVLRGDDECVSNTVSVALYLAEPFVAPHSYVTASGVELDVAAPGVLAEARNPLADDELHLLGDTIFGALTLNPDGSFSYLPTAGFSGTDHFSYCWSNETNWSHGLCSGNRATAAISVFPAAQAQSISVEQDSAYDGRLYPDPSGDITYAGLVTAAPTHGSLEVNNDGSFRYTPAGGYTGPDSFDFCLSQDDATCLSVAGSGTVNITVTPAQITTTLTIDVAASHVYGVAIPVTVTVTPIPVGGTIDLTIPTAPGQGCLAVPVKPDGTVSCTLNGLDVGSYTLSASYSGSGLSLPSNATENITITKGGSTTDLQAPASSLWQEPVTLTAMVTGIGGDPTGTVAFTADNQTIPGCAAALVASGQALCSVPPLEVGDHALEARYSGDPAFDASGDTASLQIEARPTQLSYTGATTGVVDVELPVAAKLIDQTADQPLAGVGLVFSSGTDSCTATTGADGVGGCDLPVMQAGTKQIDVSYAGDLHYLAAMITTTAAIEVGPTSVDLNAPTSVVFTAPVTLTATVGGTDGGGIVSFTWTGGTVGDCGAVPVTENGGVWQAECTVSDLPVGPATITASYQGTTDYGPSSGSADLIINPAPTSLTYTGDLTGTITQPLIVEAVLTNVAQADPVVLEGQQLIFARGDLSCIATTDADGKASCQLRPTAVAQGGALTVGFAGTTDYAAVQTMADLVIAPSPTSLMVHAPATATYSETVVVTATVSPSNGAGQVAFSVGGQSIAGCEALDLVAVADAQTATCMTAGLPAGDQTITANFVGTEDYLSSQGSADITVDPAPPASGAVDQPTLAATGSGEPGWLPLLGLGLLMAGLTLLARRRRMVNQGK